MISLILYSTLGCHLCEQAEAVLQELRKQVDISWQTVEIADSDEMIEQYGVRIPVVREVSSSRELGWPFDTASLAAWFAELDIRDGQRG